MNDDLLRLIAAGVLAVPLSATPARGLSCADPYAGQFELLRVESVFVDGEPIDTTEYEAFQLTLWAELASGYGPDLVGVRFIASRSEQDGNRHQSARLDEVYPLSSE